MDIKHKSVLLASSMLFSVFLSFVILFIDYITGPDIEFPILFIIPVIMATWYHGKHAGFIFSIILPVAVIYFNFLWHREILIVFIIINTVVRIIILLVISYLVSVIRIQQGRLAERVNRLEKILPICSYCKRIRDRNNSWRSVEEYIGVRTDTEFSHGLCPECAKKYYGEFYKG